MWGFGVEGVDGIGFGFESRGGALRRGRWGLGVGEEALGEMGFGG